MGTENTNQDTQNAGTVQDANRTFTQDELNAIVGDRLARERAKYADYDSLKDKAARFDAAEEASKTELQKAQEQLSAVTAELDKLKTEASVRRIRETVAAAKQVPAGLLSGTTEEECAAQADELLRFAGSQKKYPSVRDGGEINPAPDGGKTRDRFKAWFGEQIKP